MKIFYFFILILFSVCSSAQDNNLLAKVEYENAETAYTQKEVLVGVAALDKVDQLLGKVTPKSQFLRVQLWIIAVEQYPNNPVNIDAALISAKGYLSLSKSFDLPEEKQMEVIRLVQKLEKDKVALVQQQKRDTETFARMANFVDSLYSLYKYKPGLTEAEFLNDNQERMKGQNKKTTNKYNYIEYDNNKISKTATPRRVEFYNRIIHTYSYTIKAGGKSEFDEISNEYEKIKSKIISVFPKKYITITNGNQQSCYIGYSVGRITHRITFEYGISDLFIGKQAVLEVYFSGKVE